MPSVPSTPTSSSTSKAGITTSSTGERHIPSSTRADGSVRKEIRVRPGYRPPEDVEIYKNRTAQAWKDRGSGGVPGADRTASAQEGIPTTTIGSKNAKRREARRRAAANNASETGNSTSSAAEPSSTESGTTAVTTSGAAGAAETPDLEAEKAKKARTLAKKLRQARELKDRKDKGEGLLPEQFEKVIKINELTRQLDMLGFTANGETKESEAGQEEVVKPLGGREASPAVGDS